MRHTINHGTNRQSRHNRHHANRSIINDNTDSHQGAWRFSKSLIDIVVAIASNADNGFYLIIMFLLKHGRGMIALVPLEREPY